MTCEEVAYDLQDMILEEKIVLRYLETLESTRDHRRAILEITRTRFTLASMRATISGLHRSGKNWYSFSKALLASKSYVPDFTWYNSS